MREEKSMLEIGLFHNGASSLPVITTKDGVTFNDGSLPEVHRAAQETLVNQVRQGILAEKLGFQSFWLTEHHFQPEGAEMSPNPLMVQMCVAAHTKRIRLGQAANIIVWHHPVRLAEQIATLDVISGGRVECGIGRGYQPRENETLGRPYGSTIQDQERQPQSVRGIHRDHEEMLDRAVVLASRRVLFGAAHLHQVEPQADDRLFSA
jgi:alkanesulfonate monooxygenase SsuD/methylene tetrahydromethanopterin reductase-like flavin-dependent oxidoreductase (luciferase family)